jgi:DNA-binding transcriptional MerR regulator/effector-binding domain-containing protein
MSLIFTVKELSKITNVSARNIRYYDTIGLFAPSGTLDNGYRYYTIEKIEELRLISYLRHTGISIKEIKQHLENRDIDEYTEILNNQIKKLEEDLNHINALKTRLHNKVASLDYIRKLPSFDKVVVEKLAKQEIVKLMQPIMTPLDWETAMNDFGNELPPSLVIGETGFFVDINKDRTTPEFEGLFMLADDPFIRKSDKLTYLEEEYYLCVYFKGNHEDALDKYKLLKKYAKQHNLDLKNYALERTLIDHFISSDEDLYITEIKIPIRK